MLTDCFSQVLNQIYRYNYNMFYIEILKNYLEGAAHFLNMDTL